METKGKVGESCWELAIIPGGNGEVGSLLKPEGKSSTQLCLPALPAEDLGIGSGEHGWLTPSSPQLHCK